MKAGPYRTSVADDMMRDRLGLPPRAPYLPRKRNRLGGVAWWLLGVGMFTAWIFGTFALGQG